MLRMLKSKLQDGVVTQSKEDYEGSVAIDQDILDKMNILPFEAVYVNSLEFDGRYLTYAIPAPAGSHTISVQGALAQYFKKGDRVHINCYCTMTRDEAASHTPAVVKTNVWTSERG